MYYRVATQVDATPTWQWKSSVLSELATLFQFLPLLGALPHDQLRVFSSSSRQGLEEQLEQENKGPALIMLSLTNSACHSPCHKSSPGRDCLRRCTVGGS